MKKLFALIVLLSCFTFIETRFNKVEAQTIQQLVFTELWNETSGTPDTINWSQSITDHNRDLITVGNTKTINQMADALVVKYDRNGVFQWQQTFNNSYDLQDYGIAVTVDNSNNIFVAATSFNDSTNDYDYNILMYDEYGSLQWQTYYNGADSKYDVPTAIALDDSGNVVVTGTSYSNADKFDYLTIKLDGSGNILWDEVYDYNGEPDIAASLVVLPMCRIIVTGGCGSSLFNWDIVSVRYDWAGSFVGYSADTSVGYGFDRPTSMVTDNAGHIYITGAAMNSGNYDMVLIKLDSSLQEIWSQYFDYGNSLPDQGNDIKISSSGNVYITGYITRASGLKNGYLWGCDTSGTIISHFEEESGDSIEAENLKLCIQPNGQILTTGWKDGSVDKDIYISAFDQSGNSTGYKENKGLYKGDDIPNFIQIISDTVYLSAKVADSDSTFTYYTVQYNLDSILNVLSPNGDTHGSVSFWENRGQIIDTDDSIRNDIKFYTNEGQPLFFSDDYYSYSITRINQDTSNNDTLVRVDVQYGSTNRGGITQSIEKSSHDFLNYYLSNCPDGILNVSGYKKLVSKNVFSGVDAIYSWNGNNFNRRLVCNPSSSPDAIEIKFSGCDSVTVDTSGDLFIHTLIGNIVVPEPIAYQEDEYGNISSLAWNTYYMLTSDTSISFFIDSFDASKSLVLEMGRQPESLTPTENIDWCTLYGGSGGNMQNSYSFDVINDENGNIFMAGKTKEVDFPTQGGVVTTISGDYDGTAVRFEADATRTWSTFYGGSDFDAIYSIANNKLVTDGNLYACGMTNSSSFPTVPSTGYNQTSIAGGAEAFLLRFNPLSGQCNWATFFGGNGDDEARTVVVDANGNVEITGNTNTLHGTNNSCNPPTNGNFPLCNAVTGSAYYKTNNSDQTNGTRDLFFAQFLQDNSLDWSTFFGSNADDKVFEMTYDPYYSPTAGSNSIYAVGSTLKTTANAPSSCGVPNITGDFPLCDMAGGSDYFQYGGAHPAFIVNFNVDGTLRWSTNFNNINAYQNVNLPDYSGFETITSDYTGRIAVAGLVNTTTYISSTNSCVPVSGASVPICTPAGAYSNNSGCLYLASFNTYDNSLYWSTRYGNNYFWMLDPGQNGDFNATWYGLPIYDKALDVVFDGNRLFVAGSVNDENFDTYQQTDFYWQPDLWNNNASYITDCFVLGFNANYQRLVSTHFGGGDFSTDDPHMTLPLRYDMPGALSFHKEAARSSEVDYLYFVGYTGDQPFNFPVHDAGGSSYYYTDDFPSGIGGTTHWTGFITRFNMVDLPLESDELINNNYFLIYPNPSDNEATITLSSGSIGVGILTITNVLGQKIHEEKIDIDKGINNYTISTEELPAGIYLINIKSGNKSISDKLIIAK